MAILDKVTAMLTEKKPVRDGDWNYKEIEFLNTHLFLTAKPVVYLVNIGFEEYKTKKNKYLPKIMQWIKENGGGPMLPFSAEFEKQVLALAGSPEIEAREKAAAELGGATMVPKLTQAGYNHLRLIHYFTAGEDEVKCWTIREGTKAP
jgi:obg-like ATPase 1